MKAADHFHHFYYILFILFCQYFLLIFAQKISRLKFKREKLCRSESHLPLATDFSVVRQPSVTRSTAIYQVFLLPANRLSHEVQQYYRIFYRVSPTLATYSRSAIIIYNIFDFVKYFYKNKGAGKPCPFYDRF